MNNTYFFKTINQIKMAVNVIVVHNDEYLECVMDYAELAWYNWIVLKNVANSEYVIYYAHTFDNEIQNSIATRLFQINIIGSMIVIKGFRSDIVNININDVPEISDDSLIFGMKSMSVNNASNGNNADDADQSMYDYEYYDYNAGYDSC